MKKEFACHLAILGATVIWGAAFLAQKLGATHFGPFALVSFRNFLGAGVLAVAVGLGRRGIHPTPAELIGGLASGSCLAAAMLAQQVGIEQTTSGISAFLTTNYVWLVPVFACLIGLRRPSVKVWAAVTMAVVGSFLVCVTLGPERLSVGKGELWTLLCAALFAIQILVVDRFSARVDILRFSAIQLLAAAVVALPFVFMPSELAHLNAKDFVAGLPALLFVGILSSGVAFTLQNVGQAGISPAAAAIIMSLESVFGALFAWLVLGETMSGAKATGCALVFIASLLPQFGGSKSVTSR